jgi:tyrosine-protein kinase Etk/Wzc
MENFDSIENLFPQEEKVNFRRVFVIVIKNWHLFFIFGLLGISGGYLFNLYSQPDYQVNAAIYAPQKSTSIGAGLEDLFKMQFSNSKSEVYNQIEIIKSFNINIQAAQNLNWRTSWHRKEGLKWVACYKDEPFIVKEENGSVNTPGLRLYLKPLSDHHYRLNAEGKVMYNGTEKEISFEAVGIFGEIFENAYFHFTVVPLNKAAEADDSSWYFVFNEPAQVAHNYLNNLVVKLNDKQSEIIRLQLRGKQPARDNDYLNELISSYMKDKMNFQTETQKKSLRFIDNQLAGITDSLNTASTNFSQFKSQNKIINIGEQGTQVMTVLRELETEQNKNKMQLDYFRNLYDYLGKTNDANQLIAPSVVGIQDVSLNNMIVSLSELYRRRQVLSFSAMENNPTLKMIDKEILQTKDQLKENLRNLIQNAEVLNRSFETQKVSINDQLTRLPQKEQDLIHYQRNFELTNEIYTFLLQKRAEIDIALAGATPEVQVIDPARMETSVLVGLPSFVILILGLLIGLALPGIYLIFLNMFSETIEIQEDIEKNTQLPVLGNVIHSHFRSDTAVYENPRSGIAESYRNIRTNLQFMLPSDTCRIVAIHSTHPGEGKSFTSVNLGTILAMNDKKVVIIGMDMRKPKIQKIFNISNDRGLSTYLIGQDKPEEIIFNTFINNLSLVPSGPIPPNPSELIDKPGMSLLIKELVTKFDYIILDNPPVSLVTDGLLAGRHADLNIFILRYRISKKEQIKYINQVAENKILGNIALLINDIHGLGFGYGQNYYYNYKYADRSGYYQDFEEPSRIKKFFRDRVNNILG